jgi:hypothetical protein
MAGLFGHMARTQKSVYMRVSGVCQKSMWEKSAMLEYDLLLPVLQSRLGGHAPRVQAHVHVRAL